MIALLSVFIAGVSIGAITVCLYLTWCFGRDVQP